MYSGHYKLMVISKISNRNNKLKISQTPVKQVNKYCYLGTADDDLWDRSHEVVLILAENERTTFNHA